MDTQQVKPLVSVEQSGGAIEYRAIGGYLWGVSSAILAFSDTHFDDPR